MICYIVKIEWYNKRACNRFDKEIVDKESIIKVGFMFKRVVGLQAFKVASVLFWDWCG